MPPADAAARIAPTPLLIVHGDQDGYFPVDHAKQLYAAAHDPRELWIVPGFGHAESGAVETRPCWTGSSAGSARPYRWRPARTRWPDQA